MNTDDGEGRRAGSRPFRPGAPARHHHGSHPSSATDPDRAIDPADDDAALDAAMQVVPRGALTLAIAALVLMLGGWLLLYVFVFLARGPVW